MRAARLFVALLLLAIQLPAFAQEKESHPAQSLPTGQLLQNVPGSPQPVNSFPETMAVSPDGRYVVTLNDGFGTVATGVRESLAVMDVATGQITDYPDDHMPRYIPDIRDAKNRRINAFSTYFAGLVFSPDGKHVYVSVASMTGPLAKEKLSLGNGVMVFSFSDGKLAYERLIPVGPQPVPAGTKPAPLYPKRPLDSLSPFCAGISVVHVGDSDRILIANDLSDSAIWLDATTGNVIHTFDLSAHTIIPTEYPYGAAVTRDGKRGYISLWNASAVVELDLVSGKTIRHIPLRKPVSTTAAGSHPTSLLLSPDEKRLYVSLSNVDEVAVISTSSGTAPLFASTKLAGQTHNGATPTGMAQSTDGKRLYVANAGTNSVAVFDATAQPKLLGFLPTEWYPLSLGVSGDQLIIATGKGKGSGPNNATSKSSDPWSRVGHIYDIALLYGSLAHIDRVAAEKDLSSATQQVLNNNLMAQNANKLPFKAGTNPIKHVIYILKENRTYDQILGDLPVGNGDKSLTMYGADITPNQHKLALEFGVLDNFYDSGEVSGQGHNWSTAATTSDYMEKTIQLSYRGKQRPYDYEGLNSHRIPLDDGAPDVNEPSTGYLWTLMARHQKTYRHYGEFVRTLWCRTTEDDDSPMEGTPGGAKNGCKQIEVKPGENLPSELGEPKGGPSPYTWSIPMIAANDPTKPELRGHFDAKFPDFELQYPDQLRADEFLNEFAGFVKARKTGKGTAMPQFVFLRMGNDHTSGTTTGRPTPAAAIADNDLAVGRVVDAVSHSPYWQDTAILILEDDAQDGADHVDAHRSTAFVISRFSGSSTEKPQVDSNFYCTVSMIRTLEKLLGLPPMNKNDAQAAVIASAFSGAGDHAAFSADFHNRDNGLIYKINAARAPGAAASAAMDFSHADGVDTAELNEILWRDRFGDRPMPPPVHNEAIHRRLGIQDEH